MAELGTTLLRLARRAIAQQLGTTLPDAPEALPALDQPGATFVTLTVDGRLRGCIGSLEAWRPLGEDVRENACAAAFRDPRFPPVGATEWPDVRLEVSLLSAAEALPVGDEAEACRQLRPGIDGVILSGRGQRATFLPQVWAQLPDTRQFLAELKRKAGLPVAGWGEDYRLARYTVQKWREAAA